MASYDAMGAAPRKNDKSNSATEQRVTLEEEDKTSLPTTEDADLRDPPRKRPVSRPGSSAGSKSDAKSNMKTVDKKMEKNA